MTSNCSSEERTLHARQCIPPSRHRSHHHTNKTKLAFCRLATSIFSLHHATLSRHFLLATVTSFTPPRPLFRSIALPPPRSALFTSPRHAPLAATRAPASHLLHGHPFAPPPLPLFRTSSLSAHDAHCWQRLARQYTLGTRGASFIYHGRSNQAPAPT